MEYELDENYNRSLSYAHLPKYEQALEETKKFLEEEADWVILGDPYQGLRKYKVEELKADERDGYKILGDAYKGLRKYGYKILGDAFVGLRKYDEAIDAYKKGLEFDSRNVLLRKNLGCAASKAGKLEEEIQHESDAINLAPEDHELYFNRSLAYAHLKKYEQALEDAKKVVELKADWLEGYHRLGDAYQDLGKYEEAIDAYKKGLEFDPRNVTLRSLGCAARRASKLEEAIQHEAIDAYKKGLECDPGNKILESRLIDAEASASRRGAHRIISHGRGAVLGGLWRILEFCGGSDQSNEGDKMVCNTSFDSVYTDFKVTMEELNGVRVATKLNDYIYELYNPTEKTDMEIILVHGLKLDDSDNLHLSTWVSGNVGTYHVWAKTWLAQDFPHARVLTVAYDSHLYQTAEQGRIDLHNTAENLMNCLLFEEEASSCRPLVLVGYSFGGILIKQLCLYAFRKRIGYHGPQLDSFLERIRGIYFMGTPHLGMIHEEFGLAVQKRESPLFGYHGPELDSFLGRIQSMYFVGTPRLGMIHEEFGLAVQKRESPLFKDVALLNKTLARLHEDFDLLRNFCDWQVSSIGELNETRWGTFQTVLVPEASARYGESFSTVQADHISLSKPTAKTSLAYKQLEILINQAYKGKSRRLNWNLTSRLSQLLQHEDVEEAGQWHTSVSQLRAGPSSPPLRSSSGLAKDGEEAGQWRTSVSQLRAGPGSPPQRSSPGLAKRPWRHEQIEGE